MTKRRKLEDLASLTNSQINRIYNIMDSMQDLCITSDERCTLLAALTDAMIWSNSVKSTNI